MCPIDQINEKGEVMNRFEEIRKKFLEEAEGRTDSRSIYELRKKYLDRKAGESTR
jgi:hypothetical protein